MRIKRVILVPIIAVFFTINLRAQETDDVIQSLITKVDKEYTSIIQESKKSGLEKFPSNRKFSIEGKNDSLKCFFKQKIKYYKSGLRKERIKLFRRSSLGKVYLVCYIVKINDEIKYVKYYNYKEDERKYIKALTREILIDGKYYSKVFLEHFNGNIYTKGETVFRPNKNKY